MSDTILDRRDLRFQLFDVLDTGALFDRERFREHSRETVEAALDTAEKLAREKFASHNSLADGDEPRFENGKVVMRPEVKEAYDAYIEAGFLSSMASFEEGGMQLPAIAAAACKGMFTAANCSSTSYPFLTAAAANVIRNFASETLREQFLPAMMAGRFTGTMALTEPHAGSNLADIRTRALPQEDGSYRLKGNKIFISGGDNELAENIVHLVLAKIPGGPDGVKGISLFVVPKYRLDGQGNPADRNDVILAGLIHKMGYRGTTSTALTFGDNDDCHGYLIGEPHQGLRYMFQMMNEARVGVGFGAAVLGYRGYRFALDYARDRLQGRPLGTTDFSTPQVPIIEHADVRRLLLTQKAYTEAAIAMCLYGYRLVDEKDTAEDQQARQDADLLLDLLTPVLKTWPSEYGVMANDLAIQVFGGAGYTREYPVEQYWRDNRLNPIHEGTTGIHGLDLLGRKVWLAGGRGLQLLAERISADIAATTDPRCQPFASALQAMLPKVQQATDVVGRQMQSEGPGRALSNAYAYLRLVGHVVAAWMWLRQANAALKLEAAEDADFAAGKLQAARYFFRWELSRVELDFERLCEGDDTFTQMEPRWF
ncbi:acyl-CoA dehydrogenase [Alcanivorax hongdengensis A-11-3]|uniref:Acyl-CoA dehydrogenase n=1 Tax=Alcanivorax hongdengensis A-11-3 TaxID=1177179 RepID=L0WI81_9GAMM|nr:acyl-CoA dehydrogenase [Alcanivorax hongdengensis]EKF75545.1 acyl-CoA dehydrogenase [Alcanivorax hongdengensis A-11-3]